MNAASPDPRHLLVYEPRVEGHHLAWLRFIAEDLRGAGCRLTLALNSDAKNRERIRERVGPILDECQIIPAEHPDSISATQRLAFMESRLVESSAAAVFLGAYDEVASALARRAIFGGYPPERLRGRIGGVYHRPRFMIAPRWSPNRWLKQIGFGRLMRKRCVRPLFVLDSDLARQWRENFPGAAVHFLPDPCPEMAALDPAAARTALKLDSAKRIFLFYGVGSRRKGLHVAVEAFLRLPPETGAVLFCAGAMNLDGTPSIKQQLSDLEKQGRARIIDRYITAAETEQLFASADFILLPYLGHYGSSGVLSQAAAAGKPVIASDYDLLGRLVCRHQLGLLFPAGDARELRRRIVEAAEASDKSLQQWREGVRGFAAQYSRAAFRDALLRGLFPEAHSAA